MTALVTLKLALAFISVLPQEEARIAQVRIHGNHTIPDDEVLTIAGVAVGDLLRSGFDDEIAERLRESGRFETAEVRVRRRGFAPGSDAVLVLLVREKRSVSSRFMVGPIFDVSDEYGVTLGARFAVVGLGEHGQLGFPASFGGKRQLAVEGRFAGLAIDLSRERQINPHFDLPDNRLTTGAGYHARFGKFGFDVSGRWTDVDFDTTDEQFGSFGGKLLFDTRIDPTIPGNAGYAAVTWRRLVFSESSASEDVNQYTFDVRGYKRLWGQALLASQFLWDVASGPVPSYEQPFLGGGMTLRGTKPGAFIGDNRAIGTVELRLPVTSPLSFGRAGVHLFYDGGAAYDYGESLEQATWHHGVGGGFFFRVAMIGLRVDVGFDLEGGTRFHIGSNFKF